MKDWYIPLIELNDTQLANLFYLANLAGLNVFRISSGHDDTNAGVWGANHFSTWDTEDGKQITYKKAVKKLHKLIDKEIEKEAMELYREVFRPENANCRRVKVDISNPITILGGGGGYIPSSEPPTKIEHSFIAHKDGIYTLKVEDGAFSVNYIGHDLTNT